jgi:hypothetical protein
VASDQWSATGEERVVPEPWPVLDARGKQGELAVQKPQKIWGKIKNVGAPTFQVKL